ncbi:hypothetical protein FGO68_gene9148 [Halteria grandinella]|uniref:Uncharacterized protein n=1 Tax=Halteria grandinella TaxID=5974 RepID=A0A8J8NYN8_HALGN|nr:hypothetical protein FGO68_gene9148 [Halteria grandinella]
MRLIMEELLNLSQKRSNCYNRHNSYRKKEQFLCNWTKKGKQLSKSAFRHQKETQVEHMKTSMNNNSPSMRMSSTGQYPI